MGASSAPNRRSSPKSLFFNCCTTFTTQPTVKDQRNLRAQIHCCASLVSELMVWSQEKCSFIAGNVSGETHFGPFDAIHIAAGAFSGSGGCLDAWAQKKSLFLVHTGTANLWWAHQPCWISTETQAGPPHLLSRLSFLVNRLLEIRTQYCCR